MQGNSTEPLIETGFPKNPNSLWLGNEVSLPPSFRCSSNDINGLLDHVYHTVDITHPDHYFKKRCILAPREGDVNQINRIMLERFPGDLYEFGSKFEGKWINNYVMAPLSYRSKWDVPSLYCVLAAEELSPNLMDNFFQSRCSRENRSIEEAQGESFDILGLDLRYPSIPRHQLLLALSCAGIDFAGVKYIGHINTEESQTKKVNREAAVCLT